MKQREENASEEDSQAERGGLSFLLFLWGEGDGGWGVGRGVKAVLIETWPNQTH